MVMERNTVDVGNFTQLYIEANDIDENGVLLKLRYPPSLTYSKRSAVLFPGEGKEQYIFPYTEATSGQDRFLVFFFTPNERLGNDIRLALNLKAIKRDDEAYVELGLSNNDPNVPDTQEFRVGKPFFSAIDREDVVIRGMEPSTTPTPRPSGTAAATPTTTPAG